MCALWVMRNQGAADTTPTGADGRPKAQDLGGSLDTPNSAHSPLQLLQEALEVEGQPLHSQLSPPGWRTPPPLDTGS